MNAKTYLIVYYSLAGIVISLFTALMTYYIIDVPIGSKMIFKIFLTILATLPLITLLSYFMVRLKEQNRDLNNLVLSLSHDIKTPLTIIDGYLEELEDNMVSKDEMPKVVAVLKKETAYLNELSSEVISYVQSNDEVNQKENILLKEFLHAEVYPLLRVTDGVELKCEINDNESIEFNQMALKKILLNLLHNAIKYTSIGSITVKLEHGRVIVEDTGMGIAKEDAEKIFDPFFCLDESRNREKSGFGLGLSIARNLAERNGYRLSLDSTYVGGCRFVLEEIKNKL